MDSANDITEPASLLLESRNFLAILILAQFFLLINGEYLYQINVMAASAYFFTPAALMFYLIEMGRLDNGKNVTWEMMETSMLGKKDPLSKYLKSGGFHVGYFSLAIQLIYFSLAAMATMVLMMFLIHNGWLDVGTIDAIGSRQAIIYTLILVAPAETLIFHAIVPFWVEKTWAKAEYVVIITFVVSQLIFAVFHIAAYGGSTGSMMFAFFFGIILLYFARTYGIVFAIGIHFSWNLAVIGVFTSVIGG